MENIILSLRKLLLKNMSAPPIFDNFIHGNSFLDAYKNFHYIPYMLQDTFLLFLPRPLSA